MTKKTQKSRYYSFFSLFFITFNDYFPYLTVINSTVLCKVAILTFETAIYVMTLYTNNNMTDRIVIKNGSFMKKLFKFHSIIPKYPKKLLVSTVESNILASIYYAVDAVSLIVRQLADIRSPFGERMSANWRTNVHQRAND